MKYSFLKENCRYRQKDSEFAHNSISALLKTISIKPCLCPEFFIRQIHHRPLDQYSPIEGIQKFYPHVAIISHTFPNHSGSQEECLETLLSEELQNTFPDRSEIVHIALSGGVDSWVLAKLLKKLDYKIQCWNLKSSIAGYCESSFVLDTCRQHAIECQTIEVAEDSFSANLIEFISTVETPIYNLHPVSKFLFATALKKQGVKKIVSGDGADQMFQGLSECDLFPLTIKCFRTFQVELVTPYVSSSLLDFVNHFGPSTSKTPLRNLAKHYGIEFQEKQPTFFPPVKFIEKVSIDIPIGNTENIPVEKLECLRHTSSILLNCLNKESTCVE